MILPIIPILLIGVGKYLFDLVYTWEDFDNQFMITYTLTDSVLWTLEDLQGEEDPTIGKVITGTIIDP